MKNSELLQTQINKENNENTTNEEIIREQIKDTPFTMIKKSDSGYFAVMGQYRLTDEFEEKEDLLDYIHRINNYELMMNITSIMIELITQNK